MRLKNGHHGFIDFLHRRAHHRCAVDFLAYFRHCKYLMNYIRIICPFLYDCPRPTSCDETATLACLHHRPSATQRHTSAKSRGTARYMQMKDSHHVTDSIQSNNTKYFKSMYRKRIRGIRCPIDCANLELRKAPPSGQNLSRRYISSYREFHRNFSGTLM